MRNKKIFGILVGAIAVIFVFSTIVMAASSATGKSSLFSRHQSGGMFSLVDEADGVGNIWFVDSGAAQASDVAGYGQNPDAPFATIDYAIGAATASNGDRIYVAPGHAENISSESIIDVDVAGIRIIGQGIGRNRPVLTWTNVNGKIEINAASTSFENIVFDMSFDAHTGISVFTNATDFKFLNNEVILSDASGKIGNAIYMTGGTNSIIAHNNFHGHMTLTSGVSSVIDINGTIVNDVDVNNNYFRAYTASDGAMVYSTSAVSGFRMTDCITIVENSGSSPFYFTNSSTALEGIVDNVVSIGGTLTGATKIQYMSVETFRNIAN